MLGGNVVFGGCEGVNQMPIYHVKQHKGRSGKSVYEWRVYAEYAGGQMIQLAKYRALAPAERAANVYRANADRVAKKWAAIGDRQAIDCAMTFEGLER